MSRLPFGSFLDGRLDHLDEVVGRRTHRLWIDSPLDHAGIDLFLQNVDRKPSRPASARM